jgi:DNA primase catalytic core
MIPQHLVEEVRTRADIVEVIGEHVQLKRSGKDYKANCPFHSERTPSFYVVPSKNFYNCFGCGEKGDVFNFLMKKVGLNFNEAVRQLAQRVGVEIPADTAQAGDDPHKKLYEAIAFAADFFQTRLWGDERGERARQYLTSRGITREIADRYGIGYAPDAWRDLRESAHKHGIEDEILLGAGLIKESERSEDPYDRFRDRIIFPVAETTGRTVAFGGRILRASEGAPKYLNSPETAIYQKGRLLYGLNWSRSAIRREGMALVVEGYMDYVSLASVGVDNLVAGMGTAMTPEQATLLARYSRKAVLLYDSDMAGMKATFRTGDALLRAGVEPLVATLPAGEDPDSLARKGGPAAVTQVVTEAIDVLDRKLQILEERGFFGDIEGVRHALDRLLPTVRAAADPALKDIYVARVAGKTGVRRETIEQALTSDRPLNAAVAGKRNTRTEADRRSGDERRSEVKPPQDKMGAERDLIHLMLLDSSRIESAGTYLEAAHFRNPQHREIFDWLLAQSDDKDTLSAEAASVLTVIEGMKEEFRDGDQAFANFIGDLLLQRILRKQALIKHKIRKASDADAHEQVQSELMPLKAEEHRIRKEFGIGFKTARLSKRARVNDSPRGQGE